MKNNEERKKKFLKRFVEAAGDALGEIIISVVALAVGILAVNLFGKDESFDTQDPDSLILLGLGIIVVVGIAVTFVIYKIVTEIKKRKPPEEMSQFFETRIENYEKHMLKNVAGCQEGYERMAKELPEGCQRLLDLGCGTGLELDEIFGVNPSVEVTCIDLCEPMLTKLKEKHPDKDLRIIEGDYTKTDLGVNLYDVAVSFESLHHLKPEEKQILYINIYNSLTNDGYYIECDYVVESLKEEKRLLELYEQIKKMHTLSEGVRYHIDIPSSRITLVELLKNAGFAKVELNHIDGSTVLTVARKY